MHTIILVEDGATFAQMADFVVGMDCKECMVAGMAGFVFNNPAEAVLVINAARARQIECVVFLRCEL